MNTKSIDKIKYVSIDGTEYPLDESQTHVQYKGEWVEVLEDQEGEHYLMIGFRQQPIYIDLPTPPAKSIDKEVLPGNWFENEWRKLEEKGLNPSAMEDIYKALEQIVGLEYETGRSRPYIEQILSIAAAAITKAKL